MCLTVVCRRWGVYLHTNALCSHVIWQYHKALERLLAAGIDVSGYELTSFLLSHFDGQIREHQIVMLSSGGPCTGNMPSTGGVSGKRALPRGHSVERPNASVRIGCMLVVT